MLGGSWWSSLSLSARSRGWHWVSVLQVLALSLALLAARELLRAARYALRLWRMYRMTADIPGPTLSLVTRLWQVRRSPSGVSNLFQSTLRDNWPIYKFWSGPLLFVFIQDVRDMEFVLSCKSITHKSIMYRLLAMLQGEGLIHLTYGDEWRRHRKIVSPFLGHEVLRDFTPLFHQKAMVMIRRLEEYALREDTFNLHNHTTLCVNDIVCHTVLATDMDSQTNEEREFVEALPRGLALLIYRGLQPWFMSNTLFRLSSHYHVFHETIAILSNFMHRVLSTKRREREGASPIQEQKKRPTFLDLMIDSREDVAFTDQEILDEAQTLITAASGATSDVVSFILLCLSLCPDVQDKVVQELDDIFAGDPDRVTTEDDVRHMQYLERVIKETLRMFPSVPMYGRTVTTDVQLPSGYWVPAGAQLFLYTPGAHRDPRHFPDPDVFDPDRFLPERQAGRSPYAFLPFSAGPRHCVGQRYAYLLLKTTVSTVLRYYRVLPGLDSRNPRCIADIRTNMLVTLSARGGYNVRLQRRRPLTA